MRAPPLSAASNLVSVINGDDNTEEFCPKCGKYVETTEFNELTGWCIECSPANSSTFATANFYKLEHFLKKNADKLEHYIQQGNSIWQALDHVCDPNDRPVCVVCGEVIRYARRNSVFCRKTVQCRKYSRRYVYLYSHKGYSKTVAFAMVLEELS